MIAIVGAGITGLALGWELERRGAEFVVLEADSEPGGVIRSRVVEDRVLDLGPQRARLTEPIGALVDALGLRSELLIAPDDLDLFVYSRGKLRKVPFSVGAFLRSDVVGAAAKLRAALEPLTRRADPGERVDALFRRKLGGELYETVVGPLYGGLYASDPADMEVGLSLAHALRELGVGRSLVLSLLARGGRVRPASACSFREGMQALPRALATRLGARVRLGWSVEALVRHGSGWRLTTPSGTLDARRVVLTVPAGAASGLLRTVEPGVAAALLELRYNSLAVVHLEAATPLRGLGFQVAFTEGDLALRGVTYNVSLFGRTNLYTAYIGGARAPDVVRLPDEALAARAAAEFRRCTGYDARPLAVARQRMPAWDMSWRQVQGLRPPEGIYFAAGWWSRPGLPGRLAEARRLASVLAAS
jgi:oxygen-dependent protoporphyrinogen oxidase